MEVIKHNDPIDLEIKRSVVSIGNYDGLHIGHQHILTELIRRSGECACNSIVLTFEPHPRKFFSKDDTPFLLSSFDEKVDLVSAYNVDYLLCFEFDEDFSKMSAGDFVKGILVDKLKVEEVIVGFNFCFGRGREGNTEFLKQMGATHGFKVTIIDAMELDGETVSSSRIRRLIAEGDVKSAAALLMRRYSVTGEVVRGNDRGKGIGFPTVNISVSDKIIPKNGVYCTVIDIMGTKYKGVANIGYQPTFGENSLSVEAHVIDFTGDIYGKSVTMEFVERLRDEKKFDSVDELVSQIKKDIQRAITLLQGEL